MILDQMMNMMEKVVHELKDAEPEKRDHFIKGTLDLLDMSIETLKISPEFRQGFLKIHAEFLNYPESKELIGKSIKAYQDYIQ